MDNVYIYKTFNAVSKQHTPQWNYEEANSLIKSNRAVLVEFNSIPKNLNFDLFENPIFKFIVDSKFKDAVEKLNQDYFKGQCLDELLFLIINSQAKYESLSGTEMDSSQGLAKDFATLQKERQELIEVLSKWIGRYKGKGGVEGINRAADIQSLSIKFNDKTFLFKNFVVIDSIISNYLGSLGFSYYSDDWKEEIIEYIPYFDLSFMAYQFKKTLTITLFNWYRELSGIKNLTFTNEQLRPINIIFSLAAIPLNDTSIHYNSSNSFEDYSSTQQINLIRNWITRS